VAKRKSQQKTTKGTKYIVCKKFCRKCQQFVILFSVYITVGVDHNPMKTLSTLSQRSQTHTLGFNGS